VNAVSDCYRKKRKAIILAGGDILTLETAVSLGASGGGGERKLVIGDRAVGLRCEVSVIVFILSLVILDKRN
jgi:hypothetical protein